MRTSNISQEISILDNDVLVKPYDKTFLREEYAKRIAWSSKEFRLEGAELKVTADQPVTSGADLNISVNKYKLSPIRWHALDTEEKFERTSIGQYVLNGINDFVITYNAPHHVLQEATVHITVVLVLTFKVLDLEGTDDDTPASEGGLKDKAAWEKFTKVLHDNVKLLLALAVITGTALTVAKFWSKISGFGVFSRIAKR